MASASNAGDVGAASSATPAIATAVATSQRAVGRSRKRVHARTPAKSGALPIATIVPIATPARATPAKNVSWYAATAQALAIAGITGQLRVKSVRRETATANRIAPP